MFPRKTVLLLISSAALILVLMAAPNLMNFKRIHLFSDSLTINPFMGVKSMIVGTQTELARSIHLTQARISQLKAKGMPVEPDGGYDVEKIRKWLLSRVGEKLETLMPVPVSSDDSQDSNAITEMVSELGRFKQLVDDFKKDRGDIFAGLEGKLVSVTEDILGSVTKDQISQMPVRDRLRLVKDFVSSITSLYTSERLERNESTENINIILQGIREIKGREREEEKKNFVEWVEEHRTKRIPIPSHGMENAQERAKRFSVDISGLIFKPIEEIRNNESH